MASTARFWAALAALVSLLSLSPCGAQAESLRIKLTADYPLKETPVSFALPKSLHTAPVRLIRERDGGLVASQKDDSSNPPSLVWIVDELAPSAVETYRIEAAGSQADEPNAAVSLKEEPNGLAVYIDGTLFTRYVTNGGPKPFCWPLLGPRGHAVTRSYPMDDTVPHEQHDHPHHRSFWFTHGKVNGEDFWSELPRAGKTVHEKFLARSNGPVFGEFVSQVSWMAKSGAKVAEDHRRFRTFRTRTCRLLDVEIEMRSLAGPLVLGDDKEGTFGVRVAGTMSVDQPKGSPFGGTLVNAQGEINAAVWGKRSPWCDYFGPVLRPGSRETDIVGIAIFDHPGNFRHPTYWHARTYGLFCANPFGLSFFTKDNSQNGTLELAPDRPFRARYRLVLHEGTAEAAGIKDRYRDYSQPVAATIIP